MPDNPYAALKISFYDDIAVKSFANKNNTPVAGVIPGGGAALGVPYYISDAAARLNRNNDTWIRKNHKQHIENIQSQAGYTRYSQRQLQSAVELGDFRALSRANVNHPAAHDIGLEIHASLLESYAKNAGTPASAYSRIKNGIGSGSRLAACYFDRETNRHNDVGVQAVSGVTRTGIMTYSGFKVFQAATPVLTGTAINTVKYTVDVISTIGKSTVTVTNTIKVARDSHITLFSHSGMNIVAQQARLNGLNNTRISKGIVSSVNSIRHGAYNVGINLAKMKSQTVHAADKIKAGAINTANVARALTSGTVKTSEVARNAIETLHTSAANAVKQVWTPALRGMAGGAAKTATWVAVKGLPQIGTMAGGAALGAGSMLSRTDNTALQGAGNAINIGTNGIKTSIAVGRFAGRTIKTSVKTGIKTGKGIRAGIKTIRQNGIKKAGKQLVKSFGNAMKKAGKSTVNAILNVFKSIGKKLVAPLILILAAAVALNGLLAAPLSAIGAVFGSIFSVFDPATGSYEEFDIREYIMDPDFGLPALRADYITNLETHINDLCSAYHIVRFYTNLNNAAIGHTAADIDNVFIDIGDLANIVQPIFNAVILLEYELEPAETEAIEVLNDIFNSLFFLTEVQSVEYCGQNITTGEGCTDTHSCGEIHAHFDCPNTQIVNHSSNTCYLCCYRHCPGHPGSHNSTCPDDCSTNHSYSHSPGCEHRCSGILNCASHQVMCVTLSMDGIYQLLDKYFETPINDLLNMASRTQTEDARLHALQDCYEICLEYVSRVSIVYSGGITLEDITDVVWVAGTRTGNRAVVDLALSQVGQVGGQPYWSYYGFGSRVAWCACFVHWCYNMAGYGSDYGSSLNNAYCPSLVIYFEGRNVFKTGNYYDLAIGDVIFFDKNAQGESHHVGLVIGRDTEYVYTVEGNSSDSVKIKAYKLDSPVIYGYAVFNN